MDEEQDAGTSLVDGEVKVYVKVYTPQMSPPCRLPLLIPPDWTDLGGAIVCLYDLRTHGSLRWILDAQRVSNVQSYAGVERSVLRCYQTCSPTLLTTVQCYVCDDLCDDRAVLRV